MKFVRDGNQWVNVPDKQAVCDCGRVFPWTRTGYTWMCDHMDTLEGMGCDFEEAERLRADIERKSLELFEKSWGNDQEL